MEDILDGKWDLVRGELKKWWERLNDDDIGYFGFDKLHQAAWLSR